MIILIIILLKNDDDDDHNNNNNKIKFKSLVEKVWLFDYMVRLVHLFWTSVFYQYSFLDQLSKWSL